MEQRHQTKQVSATTPNQVSATERPTRRSTLRARVARTQGYDAQAALLPLLDSWVSHGGMNPDKELADYIQDARNAD